MKLPKLIKGQLTIQHEADDEQLRVEINPKKKAYVMNGVDCSKIDIIRLVLTTVEGVENDFYMTPDEALEISSLLSSAVSTWMIACSQGYRDDILQFRAGIADERIKAHKKKK